VNLATEYKSLTHYTKGTQSPHPQMSRLALRPILPDFLTSAAHGLRCPLRCGLKKSANLVGKSCAVIVMVLHHHSIAEALE
ncbi:hypothetical protein AB6H29_21335, partial [Providencia hangzhouensis]|uniref:hypothetical protein n=3 Tax=Providencia hangzhouensis TaxID=3031799 RepID=UPI0034DD9489